MPADADHDDTIELEGGEDETLLRENHAAPRPPREYNLRKYLNFSWLWWLSNATLLMVIAYLAFQLDAKRTLLGRYELAGDVNRISPRLGHRGVTFKPDDKYVGDLTSATFKDDTRQLWLDLLPKGQGYIEVPNPGQHRRLPPPLVRDDKTVYTVSVAHQLHCLYFIMNAVNDLALDKGKLKQNTGNIDRSAHLSYCFDYLRQALMCHGDTALEGLTKKGTDHNATDGWDTRHVCKPWQRLYDYLDRRRIDDSVWEW